jgi:hypothetical protein
MRTLQKYGGEHGFALEKERLQQGRDKRTASQKRKQEQRTQELASLLQARGCTLRDDSRLCDAYIKRGEGNAEDIARIMHEMKFFHEHTNYANTYEDIKHDELRWKGWYNFDEVSHEAQGQALYTWVMQRATPQEAAMHPELPPSLREQVLRIRR